MESNSLLYYVKSKNKDGIIRLDKTLENKIKYFIGQNGIKNLNNFLNEKDYSGCNILMFLCCYIDNNSINRYTKLILYTLLQYNPNINCIDNYGNSIIHLMIDEARRPLNNIDNRIKYEKEILNILIKYNINIFKKDNYYYMTPLELAIYHKEFYSKQYCSNYTRLDHFIKIFKKKEKEIFELNKKKLLISNLPICQDLMLNIIDNLN